MEPKQKAIQLIDMFAKEIATYNTNLVLSIAKKCAIKSVDQIINSDTQFVYDHKYWQNVKEEIFKY